MVTLEYVNRWSPVERLAHFFAFLGVTVATITGLPVLDGRLFHPLVLLVGGPTVRAFLHRYLVTASLTIASILYLVKVYKSGIGVLPKKKDIEDAVAIALHWLRLSDKYPEIGFHHPMEKFLSLSVAAGIILLGASGIPLAFLEVGKEIAPFLILLHDAGFAMVFIPIAGHFMMAINPSNWETLKAMFYDGKVSLEWAIHHHPAWGKEVKEKLEAEIRARIGRGEEPWR